MYVVATTGGSWDGKIGDAHGYAHAFNNETGKHLKFITIILHLYIDYGYVK